jgi:general secretion pathway protein D
LPPTSTPAQVSAPTPPAGGLAGTGLAQSAQGSLPGGATTQTGGGSSAQSVFGPSTAANAANTPAASQTPSPVAAAPGAPQIIADLKGNSLIIVATSTEYPKIEAAVRQLDVLPPQVLVEATIAEVTLNKALQYGTQFFFNNAEGTVTLSNAQSAVPTAVGSATNTSLFNVPTFAPAFPGLAVTRFFGSQQYALEALESVTDVNVISAPKILILDKQQASIQVGSLVPIITQSAVSVATAGAPVVNSVQYQPTGIILAVTPQIGTGGLVSLDIDQEVSAVVNTTSSTINSPSFTERRIKSRVVVQDGQTIGLAGLISDNKSISNGGIPVLRSIPVLGALFSTQNNSDQRQELLVMITPHVVHDEREARSITEELKRKLVPPARLLQ